MDTPVVAAALRPLAVCTPHDCAAAEEALAFAEAHACEIGVVITECEMPGMDGIAFIQVLRRSPELAIAPGDAFTRSGPRSLRRAVPEAARADLLTEPADPVEIRARVSNLPGLHAARRVRRAHAARLAREVATIVALAAPPRSRRR